MIIIRLHFQELEMKNYKNFQKKSFRQIRILMVLLSLLLNKMISIAITKAKPPLQKITNEPQYGKHKFNWIFILEDVFFIIGYWFAL